MRAAPTKYKVGPILTKAEARSTPTKDATTTIMSNPTAAVAAATTPEALPGR